MKYYCNIENDNLRNLLNIFYLTIEKTEKSEADYIFELKDDSDILITDVGDEHSFTVTITDSTKIITREVLINIYDYLTKKMSVKPYGILSGVRPIKLVHQGILRGLEIKTIQDELYNKYRLSYSKTKELYNIAKYQLKHLNSIEDGISLYISIPFCASRCIYCSFPSYNLHDHMDKIDKYIDTLLQELDYINEKLRQSGKYIDVIYIGGGTPSVLNEAQFERLLSKIQQITEQDKVREFTVEAGRPEFINKEKLDIFQHYGVNRISINPQTMKNETLALVNRTHRVEDIIRAYQLTKNEYKVDVNMDVIVGLPNESINDIEHTISEIIKLSPENITVHTLAFKSKSHLKNTSKDYKFEQATLLEEAMNKIKAKLKYEDYIPYYLYRQKNMLGSFENIGFTKANRECIYNIRIIEEYHDILAIGVGSVGKKILDNNRLTRLENYKSLDKYISDKEKTRQIIDEFFK